MTNSSIDLGAESLQYYAGKTFDSIKHGGGHNIEIDWPLSLVALLVTVGCVQITYNLYLHPLSRFPGPFWARASLVRIFHAYVRNMSG